MHMKTMQKTHSETRTFCCNGWHHQCFVFKIPDHSQHMWNFCTYSEFADMSEEQIKVSCRNLTRAYPSDLTDGFENDVLHLKTIYEATFPHNLLPLQLLNAIYNLQLQSIFGEICIALRLFCTSPVNVAGGERAFSKMKLVKNYLRSTMCQDRLRHEDFLYLGPELVLRPCHFYSLLVPRRNKQIIAYYYCILASQVGGQIRNPRNHCL